MAISQQVPRYYISNALQTMDQAYEQNQDPQVAMLISRAIQSIRELGNRASYPQRSSLQLDNDPYEMNDLNSAI